MTTSRCSEVRADRRWSERSEGRDLDDLPLVFLTASFLTLLVLPVVYVLLGRRAQTK